MELIIIYTFFVVALSYSIWKDREKTKKSFLVAGRVLSKMGPSLLLIVGLVGLLLGFIPPETISHYLGEGTDFQGTLTVAIIGAITFIPSLVSLPLAGSLLRSGAAVINIAVFITTLTMVGTVTAPLEIKELGKELTLLRNLFSLAFALIIGLLMEVILS